MDSVSEQRVAITSPIHQIDNQMSELHVKLDRRMSELDAKVDRVLSQLQLRGLPTNDMQ